MTSFSPTKILPPDNVEQMLASPEVSMVPLFGSRSLLLRRRGKRVDLEDEQGLTWEFPCTRTVQFKHPHDFTLEGEFQNGRFDGRQLVRWSRPDERGDLRAFRESIRPDADLLGIDFETPCASPADKQERFMQQLASSVWAGVRFQNPEGVQYVHYFRRHVLLHITESKQGQHRGYYRSDDRESVTVSTPEQASLVGQTVQVEYQSAVKLPYPRLHFARIVGSSKQRVFNQLLFWQPDELSLTPRPSKMDVEQVLLE